MKTYVTISIFLLLVSLATNLSAQDSWAKYDGNPVLRLGEEGSWDDNSIFAPFVLKEGDSLKMWYTGMKDDGVQQIGYATSSDSGKSWQKYPQNPVLTVGETGSWDSKCVVHPRVILMDTTYYMWYGGNVKNSLDGFRGGLATSSDGINWTKYPENPVLPLGDPGEWDGVGLIGHSYFYDGDSFHVWFGGCDNTSIINACIGYARSVDGIHWEKYAANPVFCGAGSWDYRHIVASCVIYNGSHFEMWYGGYDNVYGRIGYAYSSNGIDWETLDNFVVDVGMPESWESKYVTWPHVFLDDSTYRMWYSGFDNGGGRVGYASAPVEMALVADFTYDVKGGNCQFSDASTGIVNNWLWDFGDEDTSTEQNPMQSYSNPGIYTVTLSISGPFGSDSVSQDIFIPLKWSKYPENPVLSLGPAGSWDSYTIYAPFVLKEGDTLKMWYTGSKSFDVDQIGYATSTDGINWERYENNPVLRVGEAGSWDSRQVVHPRVILMDTTYYMWYGGNDDDTYIGYRGGLATSPDGINWTKHPDPVLPLGDPGEWDGLGLIGHSYFYDGDSFYVWFGGCNNTDLENVCIGYAKSADGIHWQKYPGNPVFCGAGNWDSHHIASSCVLYNGSHFEMWYSGDDGENSRIGYAYSSNGFEWTALDNFIIDLGEVGSWEDTYVTWPHVFLDDTTYHMWYSGFDNSGGRVGYAASDSTLWDNIISLKQMSISTLPDKFLLYQNCPNPFNPSTMISYQLAMNSDVELTIYNILGQKVATLINKKQTAGSYNVDWDASGFATGIYYCHLRCGEFEDVMKMVLIK